MRANEPNRVKPPVEQRRIEGPIPEYDKYDRYTGYDYFRCRVCGAESMPGSYTHPTVPTICSV